MLNPKDALNALRPDTSARQVALLIADKLIFYARTETYRYLINHDIRPPKCTPCPLRYDWIAKDMVGAEFKSKENARRWLTNALLAGYTVVEVDAKRKPLLGEWRESIEIARKRAALFQRPRPTLEDGDDIPF